MASPYKLFENKKGESFSPEHCILCQLPNKENTTSTENGRKRIRESASIRKDVVHKRLKLFGDGDFVYHINNNCYKNYTHKKN